MTPFAPTRHRALATGLITASLSCGLAVAQGGNPAQTPGAAAGPATTRVFHLANVGSQTEANDIAVAIRNVCDPADRIFLLASTSEIVVSAGPEEVAHIAQLISELDRPKHAYRLTYTLTESDGGKHIGVQHFATMVLVGQRVVLKQGDKIPVLTGSYSVEKSAQETQFTYLDVGINLDSTIEQFAGGLRLRSKVEQSAVSQERQSGALADEPIVRQSVLEGTSVLTPGKPANIGGIDLVGSTRHIDVEVVAESVT